MERSIRRLPDAELCVMQAVWSCRSPAARAQIEQTVVRDRPMAQTTILTLLTRLEKKGFLRIEKQGRGSVYTPLISEEEYCAAQSRSFLDSVFKGSVGAFANALCDRAMTREEIAELRRALEEKGR